MFPARASRPRQASFLRSVSACQDPTRSEGPFNARLTLARSVSYRPENNSRKFTDYFAQIASLKDDESFDDAGIRHQHEETFTLLARLVARVPFLGPGCARPDPRLSREAGQDKKHGAFYPPWGRDDFAK